MSVKIPEISFPIEREQAECDRFTQRLYDAISLFEKKTSREPTTLYVGDNGFLFLAQTGILMNRDSYYYFGSLRVVEVKGHKNYLEVGI